MNAVVEMPKSGGALAAAQNSGRMAVAEIISHVALVQEVMKAVMKPDVHYGVIPGTDKPTLLKQGAEVLCMAFRVADSYQVEDLSADGSVRYRVTCIGTHQTTGIVLGSGMGEASSGEEKYKWRKATSTQEFEETPANLRRKKHGYNKFKKEHYEIQQVRTEPADLANTILKMANKRAKIAMTINVTACGDMFGQDLEDMEETLREHLMKRGEESQAEKQCPPELLESWIKLAKEALDPLALEVVWQKGLAEIKPFGDLDAYNKFKAAVVERGAKVKKPANVTDLTPKDGPTKESVIAAMEAATSQDALDLAADMGKNLPDEADRKTVAARYDELAATFAA